MPPRPKNERVSTDDYLKAWSTFHLLNRRGRPTHRLQNVLAFAKKELTRYGLLHEESPNSLVAYIVKNAALLLKDGAVPHIVLELHEDEGDDPGTVWLCTQVHNRARTMYERHRLPTISVEVVGTAAVDIAYQEQVEYDDPEQQVEAEALRNAEWPCFLRRLKKSDRECYDWAFRILETDTDAVRQRKREADISPDRIEELRRRFATAFAKWRCSDETFKERLAAAIAKWFERD
jgi:hypothetical protein